MRILEKMQKSGKETLKEWIKNNPPKGFTPHIHINRLSGWIHCYLVDKLSFIDEFSGYDDVIDGDGYTYIYLDYNTFEITGFCIRKTDIERAKLMLKYCDMYGIVPDTILVTGLDQDEYWSKEKWNDT